MELRVKGSESRSSSQGREPGRGELHKGELQRPAEGTPQVFNNVLVRKRTRANYPRLGKGGRKEDHPGLWSQHQREEAVGPGGHERTRLK